LESYVPANPAVAAAVLGALLLALLAGGAVALRAPVAAARATAWTVLSLGTAGVERLTSAEPAGFRMLALIGFALLALKAVVVAEERANGMEPLPFGRWIAFAAGWLGMQPRLFARPRRGPLPGARELAARGAMWLAAGLALVAGARLAWTTGHSRTLATLLALPGLSLAVHFGLCNLLAAGWRALGVPCDALFRAPLRSASLAEFWGRRWNLAFSEMTAIAVYRPLSPRLGRASALLAAFLLSGLLHEMAISLPVRAGFGLPLLYFALHGMLVLVERARARAGRLWTIGWLLLPLPLLFHRPFLAGIVWPLLGIPPGG
jgi:alginate O-acetyltransferase complex protein AlgI